MGAIVLVFITSRRRHTRFKCDWSSDVCSSDLLNRGEGGQNVMSSDYWDQLGLLRTQELLAPGNYFGIHQAFTRVADFGFSKSLDEALKTWGHDRALYAAVRQGRLPPPPLPPPPSPPHVSHAPPP